MEVRYGPHHEAVLSQLERARAMRWLAPDPELVSLTPDATGWLEAQVAAYLANVTGRAEPLSGMGPPKPR